MPTATPAAVSANRRMGYCQACCGAYGRDGHDHGGGGGRREVRSHCSARGYLTWPAAADHVADGQQHNVEPGLVGPVQPAGALHTYLCVPITSSTSCHQAIFVDQATDLSLSSDAVLAEVDRLGQRFQGRGAVQGAVRPVLIVVGLVLAQDLS
jgi:hypothetical protein